MTPEERLSLPEVATEEDGYRLVSSPCAHPESSTCTQRAMFTGALRQLKSPELPTEKPLVLQLQVLADQSDAYPQFIAAGRLTVKIPHRASTLPRASPALSIPCLLLGLLQTSGP